MKKMAIDIKKDKISLYLLNNDEIIDSFYFLDTKNFGESLLIEINRMILKNRLELKDIEYFEVKNEIAESFTSVKIAEIVAKTLNFSKTVD